jgi:hypothetical protein
MQEPFAVLFNAYINARMNNANFAHYAPTFVQKAQPRHITDFGSLVIHSVEFDGFTRFGY